MQAMIADLSAKLAQQRPNTPVPSDTPAVQPAAAVPFWDCTQATGLTLTAGISDDWSVRFDDRSVAANRVRFRVPTVAGELSHIFIGGTIYRRFQICWEADNPETYTARLSGSRQDDGAAGTIQIKFNRDLYEYTLDGPGGGTAEYYLSLTGIKGRNSLIVCTQRNPYHTLLEGKFWDGSTSRWVDPSTLSDFVRD